MNCDELLYIINKYKLYTYKDICSHFNYSRNKVQYLLNEKCFISIKKEFKKFLENEFNKGNIPIDIKNKYNHISIISIKYYFYKFFDKRKKISKKEIISSIVNNKLFTIKELSNYFNTTIGSIKYLLYVKYKINVSKIRNNLIINDMKNNMNKNDILKKYNIQDSLYYKLKKTYNKKYKDNNK